MAGIDFQLGTNGAHLSADAGIWQALSLVLRGAEHYGVNHHGCEGGERSGNRHDVLIQCIIVRQPSRLCTFAVRVVTGRQQGHRRSPMT